MQFDKETPFPADIYTESEINQFSDLEMLTKLFTAFNLLGEVLSHDSPFTSVLLPACTEKFLQQANYKLNQLQYRIQYQSEQSGG